MIEPAPTSLRARVAEGLSIGAYLGFVITTYDWFEERASWRGSAVNLALGIAAGLGLAGWSHWRARR